MNKLICFDFDGTLVNSWPPYEELAKRYTAENNLPKLCLDTMRLGYGYPDQYEFWEGLSPADQRYHLHELFKIGDDPNHPLVSALVPEPFERVHDTLDNLKTKGYILVVVTARPYDSMQPILDHHEMAPYFSGYRTHSDVEARGERSKPHPDQLISIIKETGFTPDTTVMVGDTCMDMKMARAAGTQAVGVTWGNHEAEHLVGEGGAHHILSSDLSEIDRILSK